MFHKHTYKKEGNTLWCECGGIKNMPCAHKWKVHNECDIAVLIGDQPWNQTRQTLICEICGEIKSINLTTGKINKGETYTCGCDCCKTREPIK